jgi:hypothetical protein
VTAIPLIFSLPLKGYIAFCGWSMAQDWQGAIELVRSGVSIRKASAMMAIKSHNSLRLRMDVSIPLFAKFGPSIRFLSDGDEQGVVEVIHYRSRRGMCMSGSELRFLLRQKADRQQKKAIVRETRRQRVEELTVEPYCITSVLL